MVIKIKHCQLKNISIAIANNFISFIDNDEECVMHSKSGNLKIMINDEAYEVTKELFDPLKNRYQNNLESMKGSDFVFDYVNYFTINVVK